MKTPAQILRESMNLIVESGKPFTFEQAAAMEPIPYKPLDERKVDFVLEEITLAGWIPAVANNPDDASLPEDEQNAPRDFVNAGVEITHFTPGYNSSWDDPGAGDEVEFDIYDMVTSQELSFDLFSHDVIESIRQKATEVSHEKMQDDKDADAEDRAMRQREDRDFHNF
jgi:hypothetical protein